MSADRTRAAGRIARRSLRPTVQLGAVLALVGALFMIVTGVSPISAAALTVAVGVQVWAAAYLWGLLRPSSGAAEVVGMGLALGTAAALVCGLAVKLVTGTNLGWAVPAVAAVAVAVLRRRTTAAPPRSGWDGPSLAGVLAAVVLGIASLVPNLLSYPLAWSGTWSRYHPDMLFFEALSTSLARLGPLDSIFSPEMQVRYHWLAYAWTGQLAETVDAAPFVTLTRVLPFVAVVGSGLLAVAWVRRLTTVAWAPVLAVVLLVFGGFVGATYGAVFNFDSPSISMTVLWLLAFSLAAVLVLDPAEQLLGRRWLHLLGLVLLAFVLTGGKISTGAIALAGALWLVLIAWIRRAEWRSRATGVAAATFVAFAASYVLVVAGSADPGGLRLFDVLDRASSVQGLNPIAGSLGIVLGTGILIVAISARWAGLAWLVADPHSRWRADTQLGVGFALAALGTVIVLSGGLNDTWFALAASAPLAVLSAAGVGEAWRGIDRRRWGVLGVCLAVAGAVFVIVELLWLTGASGGNVFVTTWRWLGPLLGVALAALGGGTAAWLVSGRAPRSIAAGAVMTVVFLSAGMRLLGFGSGQVGVQPGLGSDSFAPIESFVDSRDHAIVNAWSDLDARAADWLRQNAAGDELIATNVTFSPLVPALTGLPTLASGILYQAPYGRPTGLPVLLERERDSWEFIDSPTADSASLLCSAGVRWAWVDPERTATRQWEPFATEALSNDDVRILRLNCG